MRHSSPVPLLILVGLPPMHATADAQTVTSSGVRLSWTTPGDDGLGGTASQFDWRYSISVITATNFASATRWNGVPVPMAPGTRESATVTDLMPSTTYWFAIKTADEVHNFAGTSNVVSRTTLARSDALRPAQVTLAITNTGEATATLAWTAVGDDSLTGNASLNGNRYSTSPITSFHWAAANQVSDEPSAIEAVS